MSNFFGGGGRVNKPVLPATALRIQTAANGLPIPIIHGRNRVSGNILDYEGFLATPISDPAASGGKGSALGGGGKGSNQPTSYTYSVNLIFGLCEGIITLVLRAWNGKSVTTPGGLNLTAAAGAIGQAIWNWWAASYPNTALAYNALAYVGANPINLGDSPELPNLNFEVQSAIGNAVVEFTSSGSFIPSYFSLANSTTEQVTVPVTSPYQILAQNPTAITALPVIDGAVSASPFTNSAGVIYTNTGDAFTRVSGTPSTGQYNVTQAGLYTFAAADAGQPVTIIDLAVGQAQYVSLLTGDTTAGNPVVTNLSETGIAQGRLVTGPGIPMGATALFAIGAGTFTGNTHSGQMLVDGLSTGANPVVGSLIEDSASAVPSGATIASVIPGGVTIDQNAQADAPGDTIFFGLLCTGTVSPGSEAITGVSPTTGIIVGQGFDDAVSPLGTVFPATATVISIVGSTVTMSANALNSSSGEFYFTAVVTADLALNSNVLANLSSTALLAVGMEVINDSAYALPSSGTIQTITAPSLNLSANATASHTGDTFSYPSQLTLSAAPTQTLTGAALTVWDDNLIQVIGQPGPGEFSINVYNGPSTYGQYVFGDNPPASYAVVDIPDADPSQSLVDFLTNDRYGCGFPLANIGSLSLLQDYAYATGLFISPAIVASQAANSYLKDFSTGLNGEFVWSAGLLTFVPYGDATLTGNGKTFTPPLAAGPIYSLDDDDFLPNEGTASIGVSAFTSDDPVVCVRTRQSDALNDVKVEYLDRGNSYNPAIVEAQDDAAIDLFGLRPADTKTLHFFCIETAAMQSAQLQLSRQQVRNQYSFTVPWYFILLDPMEVIAITDVALGLSAQLVRILEITENQEDWSLTITAEEVLDGTGSAPQFGSQPKVGYVANYNVAPGTPVAPLIIEPPTQISTTGGLEVWLFTGAAANFGGADVYVSTDGEAYKSAGPLTGGGSRVGVTTADFPAGGDPDTTDMLSVDLTETAGSLLSGTTQDADLGNTRSVVAGYPYAAAPVLGSTAGGSLGPATYFARATYVFATGEGPASPEESIALAASELLTAASPPAQNGATGWNLYVATARGAETKQNMSPIAIGTGWTETTTGLVTGGAQVPAAETGFEIISYSSAVLTATSKYNLGNYLRRGQYGTSVTDHPAGSAFARIDGSQFVLAYDQGQIGSTIYFKLLPFNPWSQGQPTLDEVQPYAYTLQGPPEPAAVANFTAQQSGTNVVLAWTDSPNASPFLAYDLLYGPQGQGLNTATFLSEKSRATETTTAQVPSGDWTFYIRGRDTLSGNYGPVASADLAVTSTQTSVFSKSYGPDWLGELVNFVLHYTGVLIPDTAKIASQLTNAELFESFVPYPKSGPTFYAPSPQVSFGFNGLVTVSLNVQGGSVNGVPTVTPLLDSWQTPGSDPDSYLPWNSGSIILADATFAVSETVNGGAVIGYISQLAAMMFALQKSQVVTGVVISNGGSALSFASLTDTSGNPVGPFHTAPGVIAVPTDGTNTSATATSVTQTGCTVKCFDGSTNDAGTVTLYIAGP